jgi:hypothetical protein
MPKADKHDDCISEPFAAGGFTAGDRENFRVREQQVTRLEYTDACSYLSRHVRLHGERLEWRVLSKRDEGG